MIRKIKSIVKLAVFKRFDWDKEVHNESDILINQKCFIIPTDNIYLLVLLISQLTMHQKILSAPETILMFPDSKPKSIKWSMNSTILRNQKSKT